MRAVPVAMILGLCLVATASGPLTASDDRDGRDDRDDGKYLALGDSVTFGFMPAAGSEYVNADNFISYADDIAEAGRFTLVNAGCPGEASGSFLFPGAPDNGCRNYRTHFPLHASYDGTQSEFAADFVRANRRTRLVTIQLGANDLFIVVNRCTLNGPPSQACIAQALPTALFILGNNIATIIQDLRDAGYRRTIVVVNYYPLDLNDKPFTALIGQLNDTLSAAAASGGAVVADVFTPFSRVAAARGGGSSCAAGLLKAQPDELQSCDVHPSLSGQRLIADTIASVLRKADRDH